MANLKNHGVLTLFLLFSLLVFVACSSKKRSLYDTPSSGTIHISVDESFEPVISEEIKVYESSNPDAHIIAEYKSEADCFRDLQKDSTRMIIVAKGLSDEQDSILAASLDYHPNVGVLAFDAVAAIINRQSTDSVFSLHKLRDILSGRDTSILVVVDGNNATSTVHYLQDSLLHGQPFGKNVAAADSSIGVIRYISDNPDAIGFLGSGWVTNTDDPVQREYKKKIKFALLQCGLNCDTGYYAKPTFATISNLQYPLVRPLYFILKENSLGLGSGFKNFMTLERGQLIFRRSYLIPAVMDFGLRNSNIE